MIFTESTYHNKNGEQGINIYRGLEQLKQKERLKMCLKCATFDKLLLCNTARND